MATPKNSTALVPASGRVVPLKTDTEDVMALAEVFYKGGITSKTCNSPAAVAVRIIAGREVGLRPIQSVNWIMVVNGRAVIWGDAALALVRASGLLEGDVTETWEGEGDDRKAICVTKRKGAAEARTSTFSVDDAKRANLWGKPGPWTEYPDRQLMWRARGWNLRDNFNDVLCGLGIAEEELDVPVVVKQVKVDLPDKPPVTTTTAKPIEVQGEMMADEKTIERIVLARPAWLRGLGIDPDDTTKVAEAWGEFLGTYGVLSARQLPQAKAEELLRKLQHDGHQQEIKEVFAPAEAS